MENIHKPHIENSPFHMKHEVERTLSQIRITDTSNSARNRSNDHQVYSLKCPSILDLPTKVSYFKGKEWLSVNMF